MFNLIVLQRVKERGDGSFEISRDRFLEWTQDTIKEQLAPLSVEAQSCLKSWPCLLMAEGRSQETAYLGRIHEIEEETSGVKIEVVGHPGALPLVNDAIWRARDDLGIGQYEFSRNHWAVKDRDLLSTLDAVGVSIDPRFSKEFAYLRLPAPSRRQLLDARNAIAEWSHADLDDLLIEAGVDGLTADRTLGSRRDRANAVAKFIIDNPATLTAEKSMFAAFFTQRAEVAGDSLPDEAEQVGVSTGAGAEATRKPVTLPRRVFVVHGHDKTVRNQVTSYLGETGLEPIILHDQPNMGRHLLTKFIEEAEAAAFAIVLMTADDYGGEPGGPSRARARQNVILELGYFISHLGQARVCALITPGLETPSDFDGIVYIALDEGESWKHKLFRELKAAQMPVT